MTDEQPLSLAEAAGIINQRVAEMRSYARLKEAIDAAMAAEHGLAVAQNAQAKAEADLAALTEKLNAYRVSAVQEANKIKEDTEAEITRARQLAAEAIARINADRDAAKNEAAVEKAAMEAELVPLREEKAAIAAILDTARGELDLINSRKQDVEKKIAEMRASFLSSLTPVTTP